MSTTELIFLDPVGSSSFFSVLPSFILPSFFFFRKSARRNCRNLSKKKKNEKKEEEDKWTRRRSFFFKVLFFFQFRREKAATLIGKSECGPFSRFPSSTSVGSVVFTLGCVSKILFFSTTATKKKQTCAVSSVTVFGERPKVSTEPTRSAVISVTVFGERPTVSTRCQVSSFFKKKWAEPTLRHYGPKPFPPDG